MRKERKLVIETLYASRLGDGTTDNVPLLPETQAALDGWAVVSHHMDGFTGFDGDESGWIVSIMCERDAPPSGPPALPVMAKGEPGPIESMQW